MRSAEAARGKVLAATLSLAILLVSQSVSWCQAQTLPSFELTNWDGRQVTDAWLEGKTTIVVFTYAKCVFACPMITFLLRDLDQELASPRDLRYLHISVNPTEDTAAEILLHFEKHEIDPEQDTRWLFLNGPEEGILGLLTEAGIEVTRKPVRGGMLIEHTIQVLVVGPDGSTIASFDTYNWETEEMLDALRTTLDLG
jgi:protein SCO1/2